MEENKHQDQNHLQKLSYLNEFLSKDQKHMIAGGIAGCVGKTVTAPMSRLTILYQTASLINGCEPVAPMTRTAMVFMKNTDPLWLTVKRIIREEGFLSLWRGNMVLILHRFPYSAINFSTYEYFRHRLQAAQISESTLTRFFSGATAGAVASICCYPLDLLRTKIAVSHSMPNMAVITMIQQTVREHGVLGLYRGMSVALCVNVPSLAISYSVYGLMKDRFLRLRETSYGYIFVNNKTLSLTPLAALISGSASGMTTSVLLYPADVIRRRMQVDCPHSPLMSAHAHVRQILRSEGVRGFYRGILPEMLKVAPMVGITFSCFEFVNSLLNQ